MTNLNPENFFTNTGGKGAPSAKLHDIGDWVIGDIVDQAMVPKKKFATEEIEKDKDGNELQQLMVILQTELAGWQGVAKVPTDEKNQPKPVTDDDGRRAVYVSPWTNVHAAIGAATDNQPLLNGGKLGLKIINLEDTGKGNPKRVFQAVYTPPVAKTDNGFFEAAAQPAAAQPAAAPAAPVAPAAPAAQPAAAPAADPWGQPTQQPTSAPF